MADGSTGSSDGTAAMIAFSSEAKRTPSPRCITYRGLMPRGSRASTSAPLLCHGARTRTCPGTGRAPMCPSSPGLDHDLGVRTCPERRPPALQLRPQFSVVVDLAVVAEGQPVLPERLVGRGRRVDDREPTVPEDGRPSRGPDLDQPARIRAAVRDPLEHPPSDRQPVRLQVGTRDPAHVSRPGRRSGGAAGRTPRRTPCAGASRPGSSRRVAGPGDPSRPAGRGCRSAP